jgi:hypothetical protein
MIWREVLDGVYEVTTDLGADLWQRCLTELRACRDRASNHFSTEADLGAKYILVQGPATTQVAQYFGSEQWLEKIVTLCAQDTAWVTNWAQPTMEWFHTHANFNCEWHMAPPGYVNHEWHVDCLRMITHGLMYINAAHDDRCTSLFRQGVRQEAIQTGFDRGWILLQNGRQEHRGINDTDIERYVFKWMYTLKL